MDDTSKKTDAEVEKAKADLDKLKAEMRDVLGGNNALKVDAENLQADIDRLSSEKMSIESQMEEAKKKYANLIEEISDANTELLIAKENLADVEKNTVRLNNENAKIEKNIEEKIRISDEKFKDAEEEKKQQLKGAREELDAIHTIHIPAAKAVLDETQTKHESLSTQIPSLISKVSDLSQEKSDHEKTIEELKLVIEDYQKKAEGYDALVQKNTVLVGDIENSKNTLASINEGIRLARKQLEEVTSKLDDENATINSRMKNLILLEQRVDQKLEQLRLYKEKFSVDELARMKIKPNIV